MTIREIERAAAGLRDVIHSIPVSSSKTFSDMSGAELYMKCENLQKTGSFKVRGAYNKIMKRYREGGVKACVKWLLRARAIMHRASPLHQRRSAFNRRL